MRSTDREIDNTLLKKKNLLFQLEVDFVNCFALYTDLLHPMPNYYATKKPQKMGVERKQLGIGR